MTTNKESPDSGAGATILAAIEEFVDGGDWSARDLARHIATALAAQDAAGKGVGNPDTHDIGSVYEQAEAWETIVAMLDELSPGWNNARDGVHTGTNLACVNIRKLLSAKPAQVGEKYRPISIEEIDKFWTHLREAVFGLPTSEQVRAAFDAIGAVVPAQDGGP